MKVKLRSLSPFSQSAYSSGVTPVLSAISSAVTDALDDKLGNTINASWTTLA